MTSLKMIVTSFQLLRCSTNYKCCAFVLLVNTPRQMVNVGTYVVTYAKVRTKELVEILDKLDDVDYRVYCAIEQAGNVGIWTADIRKFTGLLVSQKD